MHLPFLLAAPGLVASQQTSVGIIPVVGLKTGVDPVTNQPPPRLNINDLRNSGPAWDLYIQGLASFQRVPEYDERSFFRVGGIHGRPYIPYNGVAPVPGAPVDQGYCIHDEIIFATWHRPYVVLFEQLLSEHIHTIAAQYTGPEAVLYRQAADSWRQPYWDWAIDRALPDVVASLNLTINTANGTVTISNPLLQYRFQTFPLNDTLFPLDCDFGIAKYPTSVRCPDPWTNKSNEGMASSYVGAVDLAAQVYNVYARINTFECMASTAYDGTSFEDQHNEIHVALGCIHPPGHMANLVYSGYDPVFMLHHAAIDRHVALWQAMHYNNSMFNTKYTSTVGAYATAAGTNITNDSPLKPFYADAQGTFHTSASVKDVRDLGYTYPELLGQNNMTKEGLRRRVIGVVNRLYGNSTTAGVQKRTEGGREAKEYFVKIRVDKGEIKDLPATLNILAGERLAGRFVLPQIPSQGVVYTEISLGHALEAAKLASLDTKTVTPFLERELRWELRQYNGTLIPLSAIPSLEIQVLDQDVILPHTTDELPVYGKATFWPSITELVKARSA